MIPTLFGVTIVSFCIMQLAPGDPLLSTLGASGTAGTSSQTREAYLIQKRDLKLDKPLLLNFHYFRDHSRNVRFAAHFLARTLEQIQQELPELEQARDAEAAQRLDFLRSLDIDGFDKRLAKPEQYERLARAIQAHVQIWCENLGVYGAPPTFDLLEDAEPLDIKIGAIRALNRMVVEPHQYTYSQQSKPSETPRLLETWRTWYERARDKLPEIDPQRQQLLEAEFQKLAAEDDRSKLVKGLKPFFKDQRFFAEKLLGESNLREKIVASLALRLFVGQQPLKMDVPLDADETTVQEAAENWLAHYRPRQSDYHPGFWRSLWYTFSDTQYAHMVWRLATFDFGRSALKTREPVAEKIWDAAVVSAPMMLLAQLLIYLISVPTGVVCAVNRSGWIDRGISFLLFLLYSIPPFVAGMMFLLFLCYGDYLKIFPMQGLHAIGSERFSPLRYIGDYLWHMALPVTCLSLFSLANMAMYSRSSMLEVLGQDYIRTARAKGLSQRMVILKHALRNGMMPIITLFSNMLPAMLGGSVLIEVLFGIPGMGRLGFTCIEQKDFPTLMALIYVDALLVMASILLTDLLYVLVDPRISFEARGKAA
ncbi:MAG: ABC transporter permease subunit [Pirellulales bacterium]